MPESLVICVDTSDFMRNGDLKPSRMIEQSTAVKRIILSRTKESAQNYLSIVTLGSTPQCIVPLVKSPSDLNRGLDKLIPRGESNVLTGVKIAELVLKQRPIRKSDTKIILFIGSPISSSIDEMKKEGKKLKKLSISIDIVAFAEHEFNRDKLKAFVDAAGGKDGSNSSLSVLHPSSSHILCDLLLDTPIFTGSIPSAGQGAGASGADGFPQGSPLAQGGFQPAPGGDDEEEQIRLAIQMSLAEMQGSGEGGIDPANLAAMDEQQQLMLALQLSREDARQHETPSAGQDAGQSAPEPVTSSPQRRPSVGIAQGMGPGDEEEEDMDDEARAELELALKLSMMDERDEEGEVEEEKKEPKKTDEHVGLYGAEAVDGTLEELLASFDGVNTQDPELLRMLSEMKEYVKTEEEKKEEEKKEEKKEEEDQKDEEKKDEDCEIQVKGTEQERKDATVSVVKDEDESEDTDKDEEDVY
ncbi:Proteasome subunit Rpn10 like protein [Aduncisulcus paluster]|uniref:Proteasome subunit Rpn10 like protein n=2 Tax=Aduncisulcus paluster TaxID=2918883 RepID=A0ABQ5K262_9EUKA|nr:Proteasome subunit Rpn10 like protein [Aduncisulcus paluster]